MLCIHSLPSSDRVCCGNEDGFSVSYLSDSSEVGLHQITSPSRLLLLLDVQNIVDYKPHSPHNGRVLGRLPRSTVNASPLARRNASKPSSEKGDDLC